MTVEELEERARQRYLDDVFDAAGLEVALERAHQGYEVTDITFLPDGRFSSLSSIGWRMGPATRNPGKPQRF